MHKTYQVLGMVVHIFNLDTGKAEAGGSLRVRGKPGLHREH